MERTHPDTVAAIDAAGIKRDDKFWWALPPVHLNVGTEDFFLHDIRRFRNTLRDSGIAVTYIEQEGAEHVYTLRARTPQARWVVDDQIRWLQEILPPDVLPR
jgi:acetyl esterase/lipase